MYTHVLTCSNCMFNDSPHLITILTGIQRQDSYYVLSSRIEHLVDLIHHHDY